MKLLWTLLLTFLMLLPAWAEEEKIKLEEVVVTATRIEELVEETTSDVIVIKGEDIIQMNVEFVTDVLRKIPELNLIQNGGAGKVATVLLRGGNSAHTLVMIDGIKVNSTTTGSFDFAGITVDDIDRIEIVKGPQSTIYGSEAMAGVVNIITKRGRGKPKIEAFFEAGSNGTYNPSVTASGGSNKLDYRLTWSYLSTEGISCAEEGTERDGYENASISGKLGLRPSEKLELEFIGKYYYDRSELDDFDYLSGTAVDNLNFVQRGDHSILSGKGKLYLSEMWEQMLTVSTVTDNLKFRDPDNIFNNFDIFTRINTIDWHNNVYILDNYTMTAGAEYREERGENKGNFDKSVDNKALYLNNKLMLFKESLVLNAGIRYDDHETFGDITTFRIGALYNVEPAVLRIKSSYGTGFRAPTLNELFWPSDPLFGGGGNPDLKPEETNSWEIGIEKDIFDKKAVLSVTYFEQDYDELISGWPPVNIAEAEMKGIEIDAALKLSDTLNIAAGYTYLDTEDKETGSRLPFRPKDKLNLSIEFSAEVISVIANYIFVGERFDNFVSRDLSSYSLVNLAGSYRLTKSMTLFVRIDNLFDEDYEEAGSYGTPGISVFGGIKINTI